MIRQEACALGWGTPMNGERTVTTDDDGSLIARFMRGDTAAFDSLFSKYQEYVYNIIYGIVGNVEESRDLAQEVFLQVYRALPRFRQGSRFATWLYRIAVNRAVDAARGARRWRLLPLLEEPSLANQVAAPEEEPQSVIERQEARSAVQQVLMRCPLAHRQVLALRYYRGLSLEEIAETLGCSVTAAKVRLHRARGVFKDHYLAVMGPDASDEIAMENADVARTTR